MSPLTLVDDRPPVRTGFTNIGQREFEFRFLLDFLEPSFDFGKNSSLTSIPGRPQVKCGLQIVKYIKMQMFMRTKP